MSRRSRRSSQTLTLAAVIIAMPSAASGDWVTFQDESSDRISADPGVGLLDDAEKDYAWGDLDDDGDVDLVVARKQPFDTTGRRTNVLLLNEEGVLVDRTSSHAAASDVDGDLGFLTPTNDRDVTVVDVTGDGLLDIVTATTLSDGASKAIGHPRVYVNLGFDDGIWLGVRHEDARIPQLITAGGEPANPRFNAVATGDVNNDGFVDLYFVDSDTPAGPDLDDRLLINDGHGFFTDRSEEFMTSEMLASGFGNAAVLADMNGDGWRDALKCTTGTAPIRVTIAYGGAAGFTTLSTIYGASATFVSVADVNDDARLDVVVTDDGIDRVLVNQGNDDDGEAIFDEVALSPASNGFGGNSLVRDLDGDGAPDILISDVDATVAGCTRSLLFYENVSRGSSVVFAEAAPAGVDAPLTGTHDVAPIDLDADGVLDLVVGRCDGTTVLMQQPRAFIDFEYPFGLPETVFPGSPFSFEVFIRGEGGAAFDFGTGRLHVSIDGGPFEESALVELMGALHRGELPAAACGSTLAFYLSADTVRGATFTDPANAPIDTYQATSAFGTMRPCCPTDLDDTGETGITDLLSLLAAWGPCPSGTCAADLDASGDVGFVDLVQLIGGWGPCP